MKKKTKALIAVAVCAVIIIAAIIVVLSLKRGDQPSSHVDNPGGMKTVTAAYPEQAFKTMSAQEFLEGMDHMEWMNSYRELLTKSLSVQQEMTHYYTAMMPQLLTAENENTVCSPLNTYIAFAMLAEVSGGNTRQQILDMLGAADIDTLRKNVSALWESNYVDTPVLKSILANSLWLNNKINYKETTLNKLAEQYYASSFCGTPASSEMDNALRKWTDDHTGGLLSEYTRDMSTDPEMMLEILSTIYFQAMWMEEFQESRTTQETFHGTAGDTTVDMMHQDTSMSVYHTNQFTAVGLSLIDSGSMYFLLPDEGVDVNALAGDPAIVKMAQYDIDDENWAYPLVHLSVPKFKVSGKIDLIDAVRSLGVTDALDYAISDFTPLTSDRDDIYLDKAEHAAMIEIDEHGVIGAAYTELALAGAGMIEEEIDFVLDRPFLFLVTSRDGSILFAGVVRNIA